MNTNRKCNIIYCDNEVILGKMVFTSNKVEIHHVEIIIEYDSPQKAAKMGAEMVEEGMYDSYLVPSLYEGDIISLQEFHQKY